MSLVDDLVPTVDALRESLYPQMGTREYEVHLVRRQWSGERPGEEGTTYTILSDTIITPPPKYSVPGARALNWASTPGGRDLTGAAVLSEISLSYRESDLDPSDLGENEEFYYRVVDAGTEGLETRYYKVASPPFADRENTLGWIVQLKYEQIVEVP